MIRELAQTDHPKLNDPNVNSPNDNDPIAHNVGARVQSQNDFLLDGATHGVKLRQYGQISEIVARMLIALTTIASLYFFFLLILRKGWKRVVQPRTLRPSDHHAFVTVVIAARNEAANIAKLLGDLEHQTAGDFEVVVVDDHSDDDTATIARTFLGNPTYRLEILSMNGTSGKKAAVTAGVLSARGSVILTTDADCRLGPRWIEHVTSSFEPGIKFVSGGVRIGTAQSIGTRLQAAEFASLVGAGASAIGLGYPVMCNGANMAFTRDAFLEVGGYAGNAHIPSGDDVFLLQKIHARYPGSATFCPHSDAVVETAAVSWGHFLNQRVRWGAKWKQADSFTTPALALFVGFVHLSWLVLVPVAILSGSVVEPVLLLLGKAVVEMLYLRDVQRFLGVKWSWGVFFILQVTYSIYVVTVGVLANFKKPAWKGRKMGRTPVEMRSRLADNS